MPGERSGTRVAAFDIGSNSIKMTVATVAQDGTVTEGISALKTVRLGQGIDRTGQLSDDRMTAATETLIEMAESARSAGANRLIGVATEAVRVASNGQAFLNDVTAKTGISIALISGDEEAALSYAGLSSLRDLHGPTLMADIGGASTEVVIGDGADVRWARSLALGSGRLTDEHIAHDPPLAEEIEASKTAARRVIATIELAPAPEATLYVTGGTGEYLGKMIGESINISLAMIDEALEHMTAMTADDLAALLDIAPLRARVLPAGVAIVSVLADILSPQQIAVAPSGLRTGLLQAAARGALT